MALSAAERSLSGFQSLRAGRLGDAKTGRVLRIVGEKLLRDLGEELRPQSRRRSRVACPKPGKGHDERAVPVTKSRRLVVIAAFFPCGWGRIARARGINGRCRVLFHNGYSKPDIRNIKFRLEILS